MLLIQHDIIAVHSQRYATTVGTKVNQLSIPT